ncbi:VPS37 C-terminal domain-containing protein [Aphelenchoides besseyi]|nr:VPS37 C-terminal domain-containing protein [Aphelenchoides besseyi]
MSRLRCDSRRVNFVFYIPRRLLIYITIFFVILYTSTAQRLRWCEYLNMLGVVSEECMPDDSSLEKARQVEKQLQYPEYNLCQGRYSMCSKTDECESGVICSQSFTNVKCCTSPYSDCPTVDELGYSCRKRHPTNWCLQDSDCSAGYINRYRCCPTDVTRRHRNETFTRDGLSITHDFAVQMSNGEHENDLSFDFRLSTTRLRDDTLLRHAMRFQSLSRATSQQQHVSTFSTCVVVGMSSNSYESVVDASVGSLMADIRNYNEEQLQTLFNDEHRLETMISELPTLRQLQTDRETKLIMCRSLAESNLGMEPRYKEQRERLQRVYHETQSLAEEVKRMEAEIQGADSEKNLETVVALLQAAARKVEDESEVSESFRTLAFRCLAFSRKLTSPFVDWLFQAFDRIQKSGTETSERKPDPSPPPPKKKEEKRKEDESSKHSKKSKKAEDRGSNKCRFKATGQFEFTLRSATKCCGFGSKDQSTNQETSGVGEETLKRRSSFVEKENRNRKSRSEKGI